MVHRGVSRWVLGVSRFNRLYRHATAIKKAIEAETGYFALCEELLAESQQHGSHAFMDEMHDEVTRVARGECPLTHSACTCATVYGQGSACPLWMDKAFQYVCTSGALY